MGLERCQPSKSPGVRATTWMRSRRGGVARGSEQTGLQRAMDACGPRSRSPRRRTVVQRLGAALAACQPGPRGLLLAKEIEAELNEQLQGRQYLSQARALLFNVKDATNDLGQRLLRGDLEVSQLPTLSSEEMASAQRVKARRPAFKM